jgi:hypothetical protein
LIKLIIKLAIVGLLANGAFHVLSAYLAYYKFTDAVQQTTQFGGEKSLDALRARVVELAGQYDLPIGQNDFTLTRESFHTVVDGSYTRTIDLVPGYSRPWRFTFHTDTFSDAPVTGR